jgi:hypothetical protein
LFYTIVFKKIQMNNETKQTAVEQFAIALYEGGYLQGNGDEIQNLLEQHLEMEKEQIEDACWAGGNDGKQYYNETYGGCKQ